MTLPPELEETFRQLYERTYAVLLTAGCDIPQAEAIARERVRQTAENMTGQPVESYPRT